MPNSRTPAGRAEVKEAILNYPQQQTNGAKLKMLTMMMAETSRGGKGRKMDEVR